jgi:hypothetical protein
MARVFSVIFFVLSAIQLFWSYCFEKPIIPFVSGWLESKGYEPTMILALFFFILGLLVLQFSKSRTVNLEIEFINPTEMDVHLHRYALRIKIRHSHPTKTLKNVRVLISNIGCPAWKEPLHSFSFKKISFPVFLPESGFQDTERKHEVAPMPFEKSFDVFMVRTNYEESIVGVAPFQPPSEKEADRTRWRDYWTKSTFSFSEDDFNSSKPQFKINIQVMADDVKTLEKIVICEIPTFSIEEMKRTGKSSSDPLIPRWII